MLVKPNKIRKELTKLENLGLNDDLYVIALRTFKETIQKQIAKIWEVKNAGKISLTKAVHLSEMLADYKLLIMDVEDKIKTKGGK